MKQLRLKHIITYIKPDTHVVLLGVTNIHKTDEEKIITEGMLTEIKKHRKWKKFLKLKILKLGGEWEIEAPATHTPLFILTTKKV